MNELLQLAGRLIELEGGAAESQPAGLAVLLPGALSAAWQVQDELMLSESLEEESSTHLAYGTELLERMLHTATQQIPVAHLRLAPSGVALRAGHVQRAAEHWNLRNGLVEVSDIQLGTQTRLWIDALAIMHGDERREQLVSTVLSARSHTEVEGFSERAFGLEPLASAERLSPPWPLVERALARCAERAETAARGFREAMTRRFERDRASIDGYFDDLVRELDKRASKGRLDSATVADKRAAMQADRKLKLEALSARFVLRIEVQPIALRTIEAEGATVTVKLRRRKASRTIQLDYDSTTRQLVPPACEHCGGGAQRPAACDDAVHLLCERCVPRADGRISCGACAESPRTARSQPSSASAR